MEKANPVLIINDLSIDRMNDYVVGHTYSKFAVRRITKGVVKKIAQYDIRVNIVDTGFINNSYV